MQLTLCYNSHQLQLLRGTTIHKILLQLVTTHLLHPAVAITHTPQQELLEEYTSTCNTNNYQ
jgi:hypothetical protein